MRIARARILFGLLAVSATALAWPAPSRAAETINLYTARHYDSDQQLYNAFTKKSGIKVDVVQAGGNELIQRVEREGKNSPADILMAADAAVIGRADQRNLFQSIDSDALKVIPPNLRSPEGHWFAFTMRARVVMYNKAKVKPEELSTYENLTDPKWKGRLLVNSSSVSYNQSLVAAMIARVGVEKTEDWARGIVANMARPPKGADTDLIKSVYAGEADLALANTYYLGNLIRDNPKEKVLDKVGVFFPNQTGEGLDGRGAHVNISGAGVLRYAPHRDAAIKFLEFLATPEAQKDFAEGNSEYPTVPGAQASTIVSSFGAFKADQVNIGEVGKNNLAAVQLMDRAGWQ
ncbi:MAG TPA: Fe(3+) ABC transporter substrate-binding protein [Alphaproteobacteria bacterium]|jgi:iron(III) transport system substrate-binding protein